LFLLPIISTGSLLTGRLGVGQVGLAHGTHPPGSNNQVHGVISTPKVASFPGRDQCRVRRVHFHRATTMTLTCTFRRPCCSLLPRATASYTNSSWPTKPGAGVYVACGAANSALPWIGCLVMAPESAWLRRSAGTP